VPTTTKVRPSLDLRVTKLMPLVISALLAMSHALTNLAVPVGSN
jgi:hypothetical protein